MSFADNSENLTVLLNDSLETFYWAGFILADGYFSDCKSKYTARSIKFGVELAEKDRGHLLKLLSYLGYDKSRLQHRSRNRQVSINFTCKEVIPKIMEKYDFNFKKSYNPPRTGTFKKFTDEQIFSLIVGFIDGDGSISVSLKSKSTRLLFENHKSYDKLYKFIQSFLYDFIPINKPLLSYKKKRNSIRYNNRGYVCMAFCKAEFLKNLKMKIIDLGLPVLDRKWNKIK